MKILIIYATSGGASRYCAEILRDKFSRNVFEVTLCDIHDNPPSPESFDVAVIGGSIRMGKICKKLKQYLKSHVDTLNKLHTALFLCCGYTDNFDDYVTLNFPKSIIPTLGIHCFG